MTCTALRTNVDAVLAVHRAHRLLRLMRACQASALRRAKRGRHRLASQRWGWLLSLHLERQRLLRAWGIRPEGAA